MRSALCVSSIHTPIHLCYPTSSADDSALGAISGIEGGDVHQVGKKGAGKGKTKKRKPSGRRPNTTANAASSANRRGGGDARPSTGSPTVPMAAMAAANGGGDDTPWGNQKISGFYAQVEGKY